MTAVPGSTGGGRRRLGPALNFRQEHTVPLRWGFIGTGWIAELFAADLALTPDHVVSAVGSRTQESAERFGEQFGIGNRHPSYEALVADPEVDAVYVATPHPFHHDNALLAIAAGKHVLVEKAFTMTAAQAQEVVDAATAAGVFCMEAMWTRFLPHMVKIRELLASGVLGEIVMVRAEHGQWFAKDPAHRLFAPELGGGAMLDLGVYPVSFASMVLGAPARMATLIQPAFTGVDGTTSMLFGYSSGAQAVLTCTSAGATTNTAQIAGTKGRIEIERTWYMPVPFTLTPRDDRVDGPVQRFDLPHIGRGMTYQADEVKRCIDSGLLQSDVLPLSETVTIMTTMEAVLRSG